MDHIFRWLTNRRRAKLQQEPFPEDWEDIIKRNVSHYCLLDDSERVHLRRLIQVFIAEKNWEGCGGLELTDEIRVTIAAQACLLILCLPHNFYHNVETILVYPSTVIPPQRQPGFFETVLEPVENEYPIVGQAMQHGPVIVIWDAALHGGRHPESGHNVVYHEFAHKLDMLDGAADGTPPLKDRKEYRNWVMVCSREYLRLRHDAELGRRTFLNDYGAYSEAEFFAVATEQFFDQPLIMIQNAPDLYKVLKEYYRQDPVLRVRKHSY
ncbi:MAG TPA: zinc-dependent peptidase [Smithella sp.]|nr:zinc-dependent peptidase [Smithella sp.]MDM7985984.1 zinc-dependent peptidase [Smithella sp.]HNY49109.1 zinc-dependent peptidase [Smithella sp.]HOG90431.1 zinc-dependent peptidase [Smithella sp.]HOU51898.1 zinc-dependent peptidase [Smithella sp.]